MPFDCRAATQHLITLAAERGVTIKWCKSWTKAEAWPLEKAIAIPRVLRARDYLVGLHELGHVLSPHSRGLHLAGVLYDEIACEAYAWAWAACHADPQLAETISDRDWSLTGKAFNSYLRYAATSSDGWPRYLPAEAG